MEYFSIPELRDIVKKNCLKKTSRMRKEKLYNLLHEKNLLPEKEVNPDLSKLL